MAWRIGGALIGRLVEKYLGSLERRHVEVAILIATGESLTGLSSAFLWVVTNYLVPPNVANAVNKPSLDTMLPVGALGWVILMFVLLAFTGVVLTTNGLVRLNPDSRLAKHARIIPLLRRFVLKHKRTPTPRNTPSYIRILT